MLGALPGFSTAEPKLTFHFRCFADTIYLQRDIYPYSWQLWCQVLQIDETITTTQIFSFSTFIL